MAGALIFLRLIFALGLFIATSWSCESESDCSLLGDCVIGKCVCDPGWKGHNCGQVDLLPASRHEGYRNTTLSTWGGYSIKIGDKWHMFASGMSHNCPLEKFATNSMTIHATSVKPGGPYKLEDIPLPEFHHSVSVMRVNHSTLALFTEGINTNGHNVNFCDEIDHSNITSQFDEVGSEISPDDFMGVSLSTSGPYGPWKEHFILNTDFSDLNAWNCNRSNPSPIIFPNGTVLLMYRGSSCIRDPTCRNSTINLCEHQGIAVADSIDGTFRDRQGRISELSGNEDAVFFRTHRGYAALFHSKNACGQESDHFKSCGSLAFSKDTWNWTLNKEPSYNATVLWKEPNGEITVDKFLSRQRPKIIFAEDGITPLYLTNGVLASEVGGGGMEFTLAIPFNVPENVSQNA